MKEIYIFDIDGSIMLPLFSNFTRNGSRTGIVKEVIKNGNSVNLYPQFIEFYEKHCTKAYSVYFITGRKRSEFGDLTEKHLQPLTTIHPFQIIYYPEGKSNRIRKYFTWKAKTIKGIIESISNGKNSNNNSLETFKFHIFDDMNDYFPKVRKFREKQEIQIQLTLIENKSSWNLLI
ncbi:MAG: hypothetical protein ACFFG0_13685 [Candidatus Thorarchaeota archaeon]